MIADVRRVADAGTSLPTPLFVYQGTPDSGRPVFEKHWPRAEAIADEKRRLYSAVGLRRARLVSMLRPSVLARGIAATFKGHRVGHPRGGDVLQLPGLLLARASDGAILWRRDSLHAGDHPDWDQLPAELAGALR